MSLVSLCFHFLRIRCLMATQVHDAMRKYQPLAVFQGRACATYRHVYLGVLLPACVLLATYNLAIAFRPSLCPEQNLPLDSNAHDRPTLGPHHQTSHDSLSFFDGTRKQCTGIETRPVFDAVPNDPLRVGVFVSYPKADNPSIAQHLIFDGIEHSDHLQLDMICYPKRPCPNYTSVDLWLTLLHDQTTSYKRPHESDLFYKIVFAQNKTWNTLLIDYNDRISVSDLVSLGLSDRVASKYFDRVRYAVRSAVMGRQYLVGIQSVVPGEDLIASGKLQKLVRAVDGPPLHSPYMVRTDIVQMIARHLRANTSATIPKNPQYGGVNDFSWEMLPRKRPLDVVHFWKPGDIANGAHFRSDVSHLVVSMNATKHVNRKGTKQSSLKTLADISGMRRKAGRTSPQEDYIRGLLSSKIVVVVQRDSWEDHYRLMEALVSGGLVVADRMVNVPEGLENGTSIVFFESVDDLQSLIMYYMEHEGERLAIARRGWEVAMGRHRSWHRLETLLYGCPITRSF